MPCGWRCSRQPRPNSLCSVRGGRRPRLCVPLLPRAGRDPGVGAPGLLLQVSADVGQCLRLVGSGFIAMPSNNSDDNLDVRYTSLAEVKAEDLDLAQAEEEMERLRQEIGDFRGKELERYKRIEEIDELWGTKAARLEKELDTLRKEAESREEQLRNILSPPPGDQIIKPPGPECLAWMESTAFTLVATSVIVANIVMMVMEFIDADKAKEFFWWDQFFMIFYVFELSFKAILWQRRLLIGKIGVVWWNWLDLIIVVTGVMDMYLKPLLIMSGVVHQGASSGPSVLSFLRMLRLARLARILKIVNVFLKSDLSWAEGDVFQSFIMSVIGFNSILMGLEADYPDFFLWFYVEQVLLIIFSFELLVRLKFAGLQFFCQNVIWNWLDFIIVWGGIVDQWMMPSIELVKEMMGMESGGSGNMGQIMTMLRLARLLRILRLVRLVKNIKPLFNLVAGIMQAMQGMGWVLLLTLVTLYTFALLGVRLIGHGLVFGGEPPVEAAVFRGVLESMFVLFTIMNGDLSPLEDLFVVMPVMKLVAVSFMVLASWAILSILTAVVSENMINACDNNREDVNSEEQEEEMKESRKLLEDLFAKIDTDGSGELTEQEFDDLLKDPDIVDEITNATKLSKRDVVELFGYLAEENEDGGPKVISADDFIEGLQTESRPVTERSMMRITKRIDTLEKRARELQEVTLPSEI